MYVIAKRTQYNTNNKNLGQHFLAYYVSPVQMYKKKNTEM